MMIPFIICIIGLYFFITRGIPQILSWIIVIKYQTQIYIGRISLFRLCFEDVLIKKSLLSVKIERIGFTSSLFNQDERKLLTVQFFDVRIEKEHDASSFAKERDVRHFSQKIFEEASHLENDLQDNISDFLKVRIPPSVISLAQFFGIHFINANVMCLREKWPECLVHGSAESLKIEGATVTDSNVAVNISLIGANIRLLQPQERPTTNVAEKSNGRDAKYKNGSEDSGLNVYLDPSLVEFIFSFKVYIEMKSEVYAEMEVFSVQLISPEILIQERLLSFLENKALVASPADPPSIKNKSLQHTLLKYWAFIPFNFNFSCTGFDAKFLNSVGKPAGKGTISSLDLKTRFTREISIENLVGLPSLEIGFNVYQLQIFGLYDSFVSLQKINLEMKGSQHFVTLTTILHSLHGIYDHRDMRLWSSYFIRWQKSKSIQSVHSKASVLEGMDIDNQKSQFLQYSINTTLELWDVDIGVTVPSVLGDSDTSSAELLILHARHSFTLSKDNFDLPGELLIESFIVKLGSQGSSSSNLASSVACKKIHRFGTAMSVGLCIIHTVNGGRKEITGFQLDTLFDNIQMEWSNQLATFVSNVMRYVEEIRSVFSLTKKGRKSKKPVNSKEPTTITVSGKITAVNIFCHTKFNVSLMARVDNIELKRNTESTRFIFEGVKFIRFIQTGKTYPRVRSLDIKDEWAEIQYLCVEYFSPEIHINVTEKVNVNWSTTLHMTVLTFIRDVSSFMKQRKGEKILEDDSKNRDGKSKLQFQLTAKGNIQLGAQLSSKHRIDFITEKLVFLMANGRLSLQQEDLKILFDKQEVFHFINSKLMKTLNSMEVKEERESFPELILKQNKAWKFTVDKWRTIFPYNYNFAEAFSEDLLSIFKWLKLVHNKKPKVFTEDSPLPADLVIKVKEFAVEVCDDPFEVKLRYNYELMEDEYLESCKRLKAFEQRIEETRKTNLQLLSGKIESLYAVLREKNSEIYIKRSKKLYEKPVRTQLFLWKMEDVVIFAMADPSFHGTEKVVNHMRQIDPESPWPEEGLEFTTLWCRMVSASCAVWKFQLRDYPQSLWDINNMDIWGRLIGAEQKPTKRATSSVTIEIESPWTNSTVERSLTSLKFYHDLHWEASSFVVAYGPCWEPAVSQFNLALNLINRRSRDPSLPLPWWDKMRLLLHGRLNVEVERMTLLLHASLDPYNTTEEMELTWDGLNMLWTNANLIFTGDLNVFVRTASKYDDARLLHLPNLRIFVKISWLCKGNPNDHHAVIPCAPDKLPEYSSNQEHDSYRVFRSENLKMNLGLETKQKKNDPSSPIEVLFYGSTLRWFENLKFILSGVSRPTRRGKLFNNVLPKKPQLSRHYQSVHLSISFQRFDIRYWMSARVKKGFHLSGERLSLSSEHSLTLSPPKENRELYRRLQANWTIVYLNTELWQALVWLQSVLTEPVESDNNEAAAHSGMSNPSITQPIEKFYFLNVTKVAYMRETLQPPFPTADDHLKDTPTHRLVVHNLKGVWTTSNRDIVFTLYDSWSRNQQMKRNLSPDIIQNFNPGTVATPQKPRVWQNEAGPLSPSSLLQVSNPVQSTPSPRTRLQSDHTTAMLQQLIAEADNKYIAYAEDCSNPEPRDHTLQGIKAACTTDDVIHKTWLIQLVNSQVLLKGCETQGYVIISAAQSQVCQRVHRPTWKDHSLMAKNTWSGSLDCMQYYATVSEDNEATEMDNIMWLTLDNIEEKDNTIINEVTDIVGSGQSVGGVVSETVGSSNQENESVQLQRIVSRCRCEFFYVSYGETCIDPSLLEDVPPPPSEEGLWNKTMEATDTFTLIHYDLSACTNYLQYNMVVDILNNLLLYIDPRKKEASGALARMRFKLQLHSSEDQRKPVVSLQNQLRYHLSQLRFLEKEVYLLQRQMDKERTEELHSQRTNLEAQVSDCKEKVTSLSDELAIRIHCYNETQLSANKKLSASKGNGKEQSLIRMNEVFFRKAQWRLTEEDGQLSMAQIDLSNFLYSKKTYNNDVGEHLLELGFIHMSNLLPNQLYKDVLTPAELRSSMPIDRQKTLRIYCREKPPCGGISIIELFEINVVPLKICLTYQFFKTMMKFCFPDNNTEDADVNAGRKGSEKQTTLKKSQKISNFYVDLHKDEVEIMKQRAEQNKHFIFIKMPELPVQVSYKGKKEKNIEDVDSYHLVIPTLEYHSVTWTWLDLLMAIKQNSKSALLSQAIKHKLNIAHFRTDEASTPSEEDKARLLLGTRHLAPDAKGSKRSILKFKR